MGAVLVTGGTGFVGLNVVEALLARGEHVVVTALDAPSPAALARFAALPGRLDAAVVDVADASALAELMRRHAVDRLFPLAAVTSGPDREAEAPEVVLGVNLLGLVAQLRAARDAGVRRVVVPSSGAVCGESYARHDRLDEDTTPAVPTGLYGTSKCAAERAGLRLGALWGLDVVAVRIGALWGPWERDTGLRDTLSPFWQIAHLARSGREAVLPAALPRCGFIYARDAATGLLHLLDLAEPAFRVFNLCSGQDGNALLPAWSERLEGTFGLRWRRAAGPGEATVRLTEERPRGLLDTRRIAGTGWAPRFAPEAALDDYLAWLLAQRRSPHEHHPAASPPGSAGRSA